jgi:hypothetical protein
MIKDYNRGLLVQCHTGRKDETGGRIGPLEVGEEDDKASFIHL